jgi:hypothetical protein
MTFYRNVREPHLRNARATEWESLVQTIISPHVQGNLSCFVVHLMLFSTQTVRRRMAKTGKEAIVT